MIFYKVVHDLRSGTSISRTKSSHRNKIELMNFFLYCIGKKLTKVERKEKKEFSEN